MTWRVTRITYLYVTCFVRQLGYHTVHGFLRIVHVLHNYMWRVFFFFEAAFPYVPFGIFQWIFSFGNYLLWALAWHHLFGCQSVALSWCAAHSLKWQTNHCSSSIGHAWVTLCFYVLWGLWIIIHKWQGFCDTIKHRKHTTNQTTLPIATTITTPGSSKTHPRTSRWRDYQEKQQSMGITYRGGEEKRSVYPSMCGLLSAKCSDCK